MLGGHAPEAAFVISPDGENQRNPKKITAAIEPTKYIYAVSW
jgi:hypothetical protein